MIDRYSWHWVTYDVARSQQCFDDRRIAVVGFDGCFVGYRFNHTDLNIWQNVFDSWLLVDNWGR